MFVLNPLCVEPRALALLCRRIPSLCGPPLAGRWASFWLKRDSRGPEEFETFSRHNTTNYKRWHLTNQKALAQRSNVHFDNMTVADPMNHSVVINTPHACCHWHPQALSHGRHHIHGIHSIGCGQYESLLPLTPHKSIKQPTDKR